MIARMQPHLVKRVEEGEKEAARLKKEISPAALQDRKRAQRRHSIMRIIAGDAAGAQPLPVSAAATWTHAETDLRVLMLTIDA
jgi:hypothetical protein